MALAQAGADLSQGAAKGKPLSLSGWEVFFIGSGGQQGGREARESVGGAERPGVARGRRPALSFAGELPSGPQACL